MSASKRQLLAAARSGGSAAVRAVFAERAAVVAAVEVGQFYRATRLYVGGVATFRVVKVDFCAPGTVLLEDASGATQMYKAELLLPAYRRASF